MKYLVIIGIFLLKGFIGLSQSMYKGLLPDSSSKKPVEAVVIGLSDKTLSTSQDGSLSFQFQKNRRHFLISAFGNLFEQIQLSLIPQTIQFKKSSFNIMELVFIIDNSLQSQWNEVPFVTKSGLNKLGNSANEIPNTLFLKLKLALTF